jgi:hypothetical protein
MAYFLDQGLADLTANEQGKKKGRSGYNTGASFGTATAASPTAKKTNRYAADCTACGNRVAEGKGILDKKNGAWVTTHSSCP